VSIQALTLVIAAAFMHALWNFIVKKAAGGIPYLWLVSVAAAAIYLPFVVVLLVREDIPSPAALIVFAAGSAVIHLFYFIILQLGYRKGDLSVVYPLARGTGPLLSASGAVLFLGERPGWTAASGIVLIIAGILTMTGIGLRIGSDQRLKAGAFYGIATGFFIASYTLWDKVAVSQYNISAAVLTFASMVLPVFVLLPKAIRSHGEVRRQIRMHGKGIIAIGVLMPLSYILVLVAMKTTPVSYVAPARELSIVFGVFLGTNLLREPDTRKRILAALVILAGISLLAVG
jgi:drug/metabolite transporter (DMT)-like permease